MNALLRDQVLRTALEDIRDMIEPGKKDPAAARRAREIAVKALFATRSPDPLGAAAAQLLVVVEQLAGELEAARKAATSGQMWNCVDTPALIKAARETVREARSAGVRIPGAVGLPPIEPTGPL